MKKLFRKPLALFIVLALVVGSITVAVNALTMDDHGIFDVYTKFYRDADGTGVDYGTGDDTCDGTLYVKKGDRIKAVMSVESKMDDTQTNSDDAVFNVYMFNLLMSYNNKMITIDPAYYSATEPKTFSTPIGTVKTRPGKNMAQTLNIYDENKEFVNISSPFITRIGEQTSSNGFVLTRDGLGKDVITLYFTVNENAQLDQNTLFAVEGASVAGYGQSTEQYVTYVSSYDDDGEINNEYYYLTLNSHSETLAFGGTINYNVNNTTIPASGTITGNGITDKGNGVYEEMGQNGADASLPEVTTTDGSTFLGWATQQNAKTANVTAATLKAENPDTLYAVYKKEAVVKYVYGNGNPDNPVTYNVNDVIGSTDGIAPAVDPTWEGHNFKGWSDGTNTYTTAQVNAMQVPEGGKTFTAIWDYIITYEYEYENVQDADKLEAPAAVNKDAGADLPEVAAATKDGYTVTDWVYYDADDNEITDGKMPAGNVTAKATQSGIPYTLTYTFTGDVPAGVSAPTDSDTYYKGSVKELASVAEVEGYSFSGWKQGSDTVTSVTFDSDNIEVTGEWTKGNYTITYEYTYENVKDADKLTAPGPVSKDYQDDLPDTAAATKDGYNVTDWVYYDADDNEITDGKMPAGPVTAKATQSGIPYTLTYTFTGEVPAGQTAPTDSTEYFIGDTVTLENVSIPGGYTFSGWKQGSDTVTSVTFGAGNIEVTGEWGTGEYTITYEYTYENVKDADKLTAPASESKNYLADLPDTAAATKDGYNVTDWVYYDADDNEITDGKMPAGNVTAKATQSGIPYSLSYVMTGDIPDGVTAPTDSTEYFIGDTVTLETVSPVTGYTFSGWKQDGTVKTSVTFGAGNIEVTGEWTEGQSTVNFVHEDGSTDPVTGRPGSPIPQDLIPEITDADQKDGYDAEWDNIPTTFPTDGSSTPTVKVKYTPKPVNVTFLDEDGEVASEAENVPYNEAVPSSKIPSTDIPGKNFAGWVIEGTNTPFDPTKPIEGQLPDGWTEGIVLSPVYNISDSYYVADGVDKDGNITYASTPAKQFAGDPGDEYEVPGEDVAVSDKYKDQLVFKGWSLTEGGDVITPEGKLGEENAKYYAIYEVKEYNVKYLVDGTEVANEDVAFGGNLADTQPADPSKEGYKFAGWKDKDGKKPDDYGTMPAKDLVFEAQWVSEDVSATFMRQKLNGDYVTFETIPQTVGQPIITPETSAYNPFKFGYKFTGWQDENGKAPEDYDGMPSEDVTFYAQYELDETFIALAIGGAVVSGVVVGSVFAGNAALITAGAIVGGVVLIGGAIALAKHTYKVTYYVDGDVYKTYYILEGTKVLVPSDPVREGREFTGWDKPIPEKMPANDLEFNATFDKAGNGSKGTNGNTNGYADTDSEIPATGSAAAGISAFAVIASAAAAAYVLSVRKKKEY